MEHPAFEAALAALLESHPSMVGMKKGILIGNDPDAGMSGSMIIMSLNPSDYPQEDVTKDVEELTQEIRTTGKINGEPVQVAYVILAPHVIPDTTEQLAL